MSKFLFIALFIAVAVPTFALAVTADCDLSTGRCTPLSGDSDSGGWVGKVIGWLAVAVIGAVLLFGSLFIVSQQTSVVIERFGKFSRIAKAGLNLKIPLIERKAGEIDLRVQQLDLKAETKTQDNVFVHVSTSVQYFVIPEKVFEAFYRLHDPKEQISAYVFDVIRAYVPKLKLDDVFEKKEEIALEVKKSLADTMDEFGYGILTALVVDIEPAPNVKEAMNKINASQRLRIAANEQGEAEKILQVKKAEAEAESKRLQGEGIANQRKAIISGLQTSVEEFKEATGVGADEVMQLVLMTQYFDTLKEIGMNSQTNTILVPHTPGNLGAVADQIRDTIIAANRVK